MTPKELEAKVERAKEACRIAPKGTRRDKHKRLVAARCEQLQVEIEAAKHG